MEGEAPTPKTNSAAEEEKEKGNTAFTQHRFDDAIRHFTAAIALDPHNHILYSNRSAAYASLKEYEKALQDGTQTVLLKPSWIKGYSRKAMAQFHLGQYDDAAATYAAGMEYDQNADILRDGLQQIIDEVETREVLTEEDAARQPPQTAPKISGNVWVPLPTPFTRNNKINWIALNQLVNLYASKGVSGLLLFSIVGEAAALTAEERLHIARRVVKAADGHLTIAAVGNFGASVEEQRTSIEKTYNTGVDFVALNVSALCRQSESEDVWKSNCAKLLESTGAIPLGFYESTLPYFRELSPETIRWAADTGNIHFHVDLGGSREIMQRKVAALRDLPNFRLFNSNYATFYYSMQLGNSVGVCDAVSVAYPDLYVWLANHHQTHGQLAGIMNSFMTVAAAAMASRIPMFLKMYLRLFEKGFKGTEISTREWRQDKIREDEVLRMTALSELVHVARQQIKELNATNKPKGVLL